MGIITSQYKDPYEPISIMEWHKGFEHSSYETFCWLPVPNGFGLLGIHEYLHISYYCEIIFLRWNRAEPLCLFCFHSFACGMTKSLTLSRVPLGLAKPVNHSYHHPRICEFDII